MTEELRSVLPRRAGLSFAGVIAFLLTLSRGGIESRSILHQLFFDGRVYEIVDVALTID
jgi:hypothetical protein